jgi:uncharacterized membrane protein YhaH (DUF805 family)
MIGFLFGFNARLGRLHFVALMLALSVTVGLVAFAVMKSLPNVPLAAMPAPKLMVGVAIVVGLLLVWASVCLHAMRIRDMGWNPALVIPAWVLAGVLDSVVAAKWPALAYDAGHHVTAVGIMLNFAAVMALTFWPSADDEEQVDYSRRGWDVSRETAVRVPAIRKQFAPRD